MVLLEGHWISQLLDKGQLDSGSEPRPWVVLVLGQRRLRRQPLPLLPHSAVSVTHARQALLLKLHHVWVICTLLALVSPLSFYFSSGFDTADHFILGKFLSHPRHDFLPVLLMAQFILVILA